MNSKRYAATGLFFLALSACSGASQSESDAGNVTTAQATSSLSSSAGSSVNSSAASSSISSAQSSSSVSSSSVSNSVSSSVASSVSSSVSSSSSSSSVSQSSVSSVSSSAASSSSSSSAASSTSSVSSSSSSVGALNHVSFTSTPSLGGLGTEWVTGETRLVKDNSTQGSGELFAFMWTSGTGMYLITSANNGQTWSTVSSASSNACSGACPKKVIALTQDPTGAVHAIAFTGTTADSGYYLRINLTYNAGHISGFSLATTTAIALLPNVTRTGAELRADIKIVKDANSNAIIVYAINLVTLASKPDHDMKVYMGKSLTLTPTLTSDFVGVTGSGGATLVFDSCNYSVSSVSYNNCTDSSGQYFSTHTHNALFAQNAASGDLYLFQGPIDADYGFGFGGGTALQKNADTVFASRLTRTSTGWSVGSPSVVSSNITSSGHTPELMSVATSGNYAWLMYVNPVTGVRFGRINSAGVYSETSVTSPDTTADRNGWGVFTVSADDSKIWAIWDTMSDTGASGSAGPTAIAKAGYWDGTSWTTSSLVGSDSMGMAGVSGWVNGTAGLLFKGAVGPQTYQQPAAASIWSN